MNIKIDSPKDFKTEDLINGIKKNDHEIRKSIYLHSFDSVGYLFYGIDFCKKEKKESVMKKKKVIFKVLACRICGEQGVSRIMNPGLSSQGIEYFCPINSDHELNEFSLPYEMKLKQEINLPEVGRYIRVFTKGHGDRSFIGKVIEVDKENNTVSYCHDNFAIEKVRSFSINQFGWKYLKEV